MTTVTDKLEKPDTLPWHSMGDGAYYKLLRYSPETGAFSIILRVDKGGTFQAHRHLAERNFS